jgi:hypothetical protein
MPWKRRSGSFLRQRVMTRSVSAGRPSTTWVTGFGSPRNTAASVAAWESPWNARRPVTIS